MSRLSCLGVALVTACVAPTPHGHVCGRAQVEIDVELADDGAVDLLIVVDGSSAMADFESLLAGQVPRLVELLATGDVDDDGAPDLVPTRSLHVAVIDMDAGAGDAPVDPSCGLERHGVLREASDASGAPCDGIPVSPTPGVFTFQRNGSDVLSRAAAVDCAATVGSSECRYARGLDAIVTALDPASGNGFLRHGSTLGIVVVTAQDDCSTMQPEIFSGQAPFDTVTPSLRCHAFDDRLEDVDAVARVLVALRPSPGDLFFGLVGGVPPALAGGDPTSILADPAMQARVDPANGGRLASVCSAHGEAFATPSRRWVALAAALQSRGADVDVESICNLSLVPVVDTTTILPARITQVCLPRPLAVDALGAAPCTVVEVLPPIGSGGLVEHCRDLPSPEAFATLAFQSRSHDGIVGQSEVCLVSQIDPRRRGMDAGWLYDDLRSDADCPQAITFSVIQQPVGGVLRVMCEEQLLPATHSAASLGMSCDPGTQLTRSRSPAACATGHAIDGDVTSPALSCDAFTRMCGVACATDTDCAATGLPMCDLRDGDTFFEGGAPSELAHVTRGFCVDPECDAR